MYHPRVRPLPGDLSLMTAYRPTYGSQRPIGLAWPGADE